MPSLAALLLPLVLLAINISPSAANSCITTADTKICCPGYLIGGLLSNAAHGICCIDPSTSKRRSIDVVNVNNNILINRDIRRSEERKAAVNTGVSTCSENDILVPLSATDYEKRVSSIMASITGGGSRSDQPTNSADSADSAAEPTKAATQTAQEGPSKTTQEGPSKTAQESPSKTTTTTSTGGMPAATGHGSYIAAIGGAVAAAVLVAGAL
ncbi:hypothetical protein ACJ72_06925 [Emergomyces africanus]|uniref:Hydrophobin n=1 Tax=Emergomyces africanus TaxID=1955775 RepID=A0A1B7NQ25_9EURO|nr:hypothetical protein ACJ72_06925 [Emergomyces africanus]